MITQIEVIAFFTKIGIIRTKKKPKKSFIEK